MNQEKDEELRFLLSQDGLNKTEVHRVKDLSFDAGFQCCTDYFRKQWEKASSYDEFAKMLFSN